MDMASSEDLGQFDCSTVDGQMRRLHAYQDSRSTTKGNFRDEQGNAIQLELVVDYDCHTGYVIWVTEWLPVTQLSVGHVSG